MPDEVAGRFLMGWCEAEQARAQAGGRAVSGLPSQRAGLVNERRGQARGREI